MQAWNSGLREKKTKRIVDCVIWYEREKKKKEMQIMSMHGCAAGKEKRGVGSSYPLTQVPVLLLLLCVFCDLTTREMYLNVCSVYIFV